MSPAQMRAALLDRYPGSARIAYMPEKQVHAMYTRLLSAGKL